MKIFSKYEANITFIRVNEMTFELDKITDETSLFKLISWTSFRYISVSNFMEIDKVLIRPTKHSSFKISIEFYINVLKLNY